MIKWGDFPVLLFKSLFSLKAVYKQHVNGIHPLWKKNKIKHDKNLNLISSSLSPTVSNVCTKLEESLSNPNNPQTETLLPPATTGAEVKKTKCRAWPIYLTSSQHRI